MGPPDRPRHRHAPARGPRGRPRAAHRAVPSRAAARAGDGGSRSRVRRVRGGAGQQEPVERTPGGRRSIRARQRPLRRALAGPGRGAAGATRHRERDQQRLDRAAGLVRRTAVPPHGRRGGRNRSDPRGSRASAGRPPESGAPREPYGDIGCASRRGPARRGAHLGWSEEHLRASGTRNPRQACGPRCDDLPDGPRGQPGRGPRRAYAQRPNRAGASAGSHARCHRPADAIPGRPADTEPSRDRSRRPV